MFLNVCETYKLNPFKREIHFVKYGDKPGQIIVGYECYIKRAELTGLLDGWHVEIADDTSEATITIHRKDFKHPFKWTIYREEVDTKQSTWVKMPKFMIKKTVIGQGFRLCFSTDLGGMAYAPEEMGLEVTSAQLPADTVVTGAATPPAAAPPPVTPPPAAAPPAAPAEQPPIEGNPADIQDAPPVVTPPAQPPPAAAPPVQQPPVVQPPAAAEPVKPANAPALAPDHIQQIIRRFDEIPMGEGQRSITQDDLEGYVDTEAGQWTVHEKDILLGAYNQIMKAGTMQATAMYRGLD